MSRATAQPVCITTKACCARLPPADVVAVSDPSRNVRCRSVRSRSRTGATLSSAAAIVVSRSANATTRVSIRYSIPATRTPVCSDATVCNSRRAMAVKLTPTTTPAPQSSMFSTKRYRTSAPVLAPSAPRTANSRRCRSVRTSDRLATLAQPMTRIAATIPAKIRSRDRVAVIYRLRNGATPKVVRAFSGRPSLAAASRLRSSPTSCSDVAPRTSRASTLIERSEVPVRGSR